MSDAIKPACFDSAMDFLGDPEATEVIAYVKALESGIDAAIAAERERCAKLVEAGIDPQCREIEDEALRQAAARIRQPVDNLQQQ